jgi:hypothetical protein
MRMARMRQVSVERSTPIRHIRVIRILFTRAM